MSRGKNLLKNTAILMVAKISTQLISFFLLPVYTSVLTTAEYGRIDIYSSLAMIIIPLLTLQLEMGLFRFFIDTEDKKEQKSYVTTAFVVSFLITLVSSGVFIAVGFPLHVEYLWYLIGYYSSLMLSTLLLQLCRAKGDNFAYGLATLIASAVAIGLNILFVVVLKIGVKGVLISSIIAQLVSSLFMIFKTRFFSYIDFKSMTKDRTKKLLKYSTPLVFNQISSWAVNYSDRLVILSFFGEGTNGIYSAANKFSSITSTFFNVYNIAWTENVARCKDDPDSNAYVSKVFKLTFIIYLSLVIGIINVLPFVFNLLIGENFLEAYQHVPILLVGMFFSGMAATIGSVYIAFFKTKEVSITTVLAGVVNIVTHLALINFIGLYAASISTLISFLALFVFRAIRVQKLYKIKMPYLTMIIQSGILAVSWIGYSMKNYIIIIIGLVLNLAYIAFIFIQNRKTIISIFKRKKPDSVDDKQTSNDKKIDEEVLAKETIESVEGNNIIE